MNIEFDLGKMSTPALKNIRDVIEGLLKKRATRPLQKGQVWQEEGGERYLVVQTGEARLSFLFLKDHDGPPAIGPHETCWEWEGKYAPGDAAPDDLTEYLGEWEDLTSEL